MKLNSVAGRVSQRPFLECARSPFRAKAGAALVAGAVGLLCSAPATHAQLSFASPVINYNTGTCPLRSFAGYPSFVAVGDFNRDGKPDLAVANYGCGTVSILLGNGDGTFQAAIDYAVQRDGAQGIAVGDFNGDHNPDLAVCNSIGHSVSILLGNGDGTFQAEVHYAAHDTPIDAAVRDFNADGKSDLAVVTNGGNTVSILLGNGDGTFQPAVSYSVGDYPFSVTVGYFNADLIPDLAVANYNTVGLTGSVSILLGNGDGTFQPAVAYDTGLHSISVVTGDFNGDHKPDLAAANGISNDVSILLGNGDGTFQGAASYPAGNHAHWVAVSDFNADGRPDLAVTNDVDRSVSILLGNADGTFQPAVNFSQAFAFGDPLSIAVGDFNADGRPDLVTANTVGDNVSVLLNTSDGPPTAVAGPNQSIHVQGAVILNGSASFDDNTPSASLVYTWSFVSVPAGSAAVLAAPHAAMTGFIADLQGSYIVQLVVADSIGHESAPSQVVISSTNLAPTANAGPDHVSVIGSAVVLNGAASTDPELDPLTYQWTLVTSPVGSIASLTGAQSVAAAFVPDLPGPYTVSLVVDDGLGPSLADTVLVTGITGLQYAENAAMTVMAGVNALPPSFVTTAGNQQAFGNFLTQAIQSMQSNNLAQARQKLQLAIERTDGCALRGHPDTAGPGRDWILDCPAQIGTYNQLVAALNAIAP